MTAFGFKENSARYLLEMNLAMFLLTTLTWLVMVNGKGLFVGMFPAIMYDLRGRQCGRNEAAYRSLDRSVSFSRMSEWGEASVMEPAP